MPLYPYTDLQTISTPLLHASSLKGVVPSWDLSIQRPDAIPHHLEHRPYSRSWPVDDLRQALAARARAVPRQAQPAMRRAGPPDAQAGLIDAPLPPPPPEFPADTVWLVYITAQLCTGARLRSREATDAITVYPWWCVRVMRGERSDDRLSTTSRPICSPTAARSA
eukprot:CAMPEP_0198689180 /NCGR_PEP_ID=MMETSP1468-20131203/132006_1 /TAXON_ID=1461545 /ORGANISM="Mantoniella sp, Strain CCMP1436" /LENGTH=165 /DNA_ID=CAMNT_0044439893 /DNA_START=223 /DNA_END=718 /DNA_ORIENTATION=-